MVQKSDIYGLHFLGWISRVVPFNMRPISSWEENECCYKLSKCTKWNIIGSKWSKLSFWVKIVVILSVAQLEQQVFSAQLEISHMLNGTTPKIQHRKWGPMPLSETRQPILPYLTSCWRSYREGRRRMVIRCENILLALKQFLIIHPRIFQVKINDFSFSSLQSKVL